VTGRVTYAWRHSGLLAARVQRGLTVSSASVVAELVVGLGVYVSVRTGSLLANLAWPARQRPWRRHTRRIGAALSNPFRIARKAGRSD
jgi:hypothetical protein